MDSNLLNRQRLIECRQKLGITKQEAAKRVKLSQPAYLRYESGERMPSIHVIQEMANVFGTSADYLTGKTDIATPTSYTIHAETNPELFQFIEMYQNSDNSKRDNLIAYMKNFKENLK